MAAYLVCLTTLMTATHLVHVTMDTPATSVLSSTTVDQPNPLILLHRVDTDSNWKEMTLDSLGINSFWEWSEPDRKHYATIQNCKDSINSEKRPQITYDSIALGGLHQIRHGTVTSATVTHITADNRTPPLTTADHYEHCQTENALDTWYDYLLNKLWEWTGWPCEQGNGTDNNVRKDETEVIGTALPKPDLITDNYTDLATLGTGPSTIQVIVCQERSELLVPVCSLSS